MHHAQLVIGSREWGIAHIPESERIPTTDVNHLVYEKFTIGDARSLSNAASLRPTLRTQSTFVIICSTILREAQNALLKLFEEPPEHAHFYVIVPHEDLLLPTLRSRFHLLAKQEQTPSGTFADCMKLSLADRLSCIAKKTADGDAEWIDAYLRGAAHHAHTTQHVALIRDVLFVESHIRANGASKKMLLEHLALLV